MIASTVLILVQSLAPPHGIHKGQSPRRPGASRARCPASVTAALAKAGGTAGLHDYGLMLGAQGDPACFLLSDAARFG
jgi:hypothetical protein